MPQPPSDPLARVKRAATERRAADEEYRAALQAARDAGHSAADIAKPAGVSRQAVLKLTTAPDTETKWQTKAEARLAELDQRWEALVDRVADVERPPDQWIRWENAKRNGRRGKDARAGRPQRPSVLEENRAFAETKLLHTLRDNREDPSVRKILRELHEANTLRDRLEALYDHSIGL